MGGKPAGGERDFAGWLRRQLTRREMSAADLSRALGMGSGAVSEWLGRKRLPSPASCLRLADVFDADPDAVLALAGHLPTARPADPDDPVARVSALLRRVDLGRYGRAQQLEDQLRGWIRYDREHGANGNGAANGQSA